MHEAATPDRSTAVATSPARPVATTWPKALSAVSGVAAVAPARRTLTLTRPSGVGLGSSCHCTAPALLRVPGTVTTVAAEAGEEQLCAVLASAV